ncbi:M48 family metallopeptidase [Helicobacter pylori]|uniref:M48 family metallopeptidase n=1 Tax=Helicobacter pylori TaxID=210 RepID=UPI0019324725|nr:M48 family metallopeptidase [Helicobacter pylori]MBM0604300.1 M48 family metallopeptidase [Helicobacter pylori]MBM0614784.1 M48 family metallopeptidase [Helicobacter pylori]MBM0615820.1 M48 family metallopeptidase [Helicobacter pylori]MBM0617090.1 M48 family metallopeptidase [Helicobacter pylori]MBM0629490.1 M48 family metallopeptidase [Helicobacter pylori]
MLDNIPITIQKSKKIKTLSLNITPSLEVILKMPDSYPQARVNAFLKEQEAWLKKTFLAMQEKHSLLRSRLNTYKDKILVFDEVKNANDYTLTELKKILKTYLERKLPLIAQKMQTSYTGFSVRNNAKVLGSCSYHNRLSFALLLVCTKKEAIDYVIIHELAHTIHKNHSKNFWRCVQTFCPNYRALRDHLKQRVVFYTLLLKPLQP